MVSSRLFTGGLRRSAFGADLHEEVSPALHRRQKIFGEGDDGADGRDGAKTPVFGVLSLKRQTFHLGLTAGGDGVGGVQTPRALS